MSALPPIYKAFEELSTDERFDGLGLELERRDVTSYRPNPLYEIRVKARASGDAAAYGTLVAALGQFAGQHMLDTEVNGAWVTLTPRGQNG
jgi:hypothetical protein